MLKNKDTHKSYKTFKSITSRSKRSFLIDKLEKCHKEND